jgi:formyl-CoA transferase
VILVRVSGYGQDGPYADRVGFASAAEAYGGLRHLNGFPDGPPPRYGVSMGDSLGAMFAVQGALAALYHRDVAGGRGQVVDVSLVESCFAMTESVITEYAALGAVRGPSGTNLAGIAPSNLFRSRDGRWVVIAANQDTLFRRLCEVMGRPELADDPRFCDHLARGQNQDEIEGLIGDWAAGFDAADLSRMLDAAGVVCAPVNTAADILDDPHFAERGMIATQTDSHHGTLRTPGVVPRYSDTPADVRWSGKWDVGADNAVVFGELLGLTQAERDELAAAGVI